MYPKSKLFIVFKTGFNLNDPITKIKGTKYM